MRSTQSPNPGRLHTLLLANMAVGVAVAAVAVYSMITGEYANLPARQATEALLNKFAIGGLLYSAASWYVDQFVRPIWSKAGVGA
ncbi:MAG: hypothetical protein HY941_08295 [Gammaproteobacteria bacterium]|nr:hypothetical protein [Gammaproteobacteria bacterium]